MELLTVAAISAGATGYWIWVYYVIQPRPFADGWYIYRLAYTNKPTSPPYCWRPLVPLLLRYLGPWTSHAASFATPLVIYGYLGGGWAAVAVSLAFVGNRHIFGYDVKHPEMSESVGHLLLASGLWALSVGSPWAVALLVAAMLCREALGAMLIVVAGLTGAWIPVGAALAAGAVAYFGRREDKENRHPLVESSNYETAKRWVKAKGQHAFDWPQFIGSVRGAPLFVPFGWNSVGSFEHLALAAYVLWDSQSPQAESPGTSHTRSSSSPPSWLASPSSGPGSTASQAGSGPSTTATTKRLQTVSVSSSMPVARCNACSRVATKRTVADGEVCVCGCKVFYPSWRTIPQWIACKLGWMHTIEPPGIKEGELGGTNEYLQSLHEGNVP